MIIEIILLSVAIFFSISIIFLLILRVIIGYSELGEYTKMVDRIFEKYSSSK